MTTPSPWAERESDGDENPYQPPRFSSPSPEDPSRSKVSTTILAIGIWTFAVLGILRSRTVFLRMVAEFNLELPILTKIGLSPAFAVAIVLVLAATVIKQTLPLGPTTKNFWNRFAFWLGLGTICLYAFAVFEVLLTLITGLSGG